MGRIKSLQPQSTQSLLADVGAGLFSVRYRKLVDHQHDHQHQQQQTNNATSVAVAQQVQLQVQNLIRMRLGLSQDYIAYCCGQCGHRQRLDIKADELQSMVGDALRMSSSDGSPASSAQQLFLPAAKNAHTSWTKQFHDKNRHSKSNNIQQEPEKNLKEMSKCCSKPLIKQGKTCNNASGALVIPCHPHHPLMKGYKSLEKSNSFSDRSPSPSVNNDHDNDNDSSSTTSSGTYAPTLPVRTDSLTNLEEEALLKCAPWFQAGIPREISLEILRQEPVGSFLVRQSTSKPGCYALSVRVPKDKGQSSSGIAHYLITQSNRGFKIKGFTKEFPSLTSLIVHHSVMPELLPCPLLMHRPSTGLLADYLDNNNFVDIDSSIILELTKKCDK